MKTPADPERSALPAPNAASTGCVWRIALAKHDPDGSVTVFPDGRCCALCQGRTKDTGWAITIANGNATPCSDRQGPCVDVRASCMDARGLAADDMMEGPSRSTHG